MGTAGDGVARLPSGEVVFVDGAFPGDLVEIRLTRKRKRVQFAEVSRLIEPSAQRVESRCPVDACGGCATRWYARAGQAEEKRERVVQAIRRIGGLEIGERIGTVVQGAADWGYRHRVRLHAAFYEGGWHLGYHGRRSHRLVPLLQCPVLCDELEQAALRLADAVAGLPRHAELDQIELIASHRDQAAAARISAGGALSGFRDALDPLAASGLAGIELVTPEESWSHGELALRYDHERTDVFELWAEPGVFTQANPQVNELLVAAVARALPVETAPRVLELHAGVGNFSLPLAAAGATVFTAEHQERAVLLAQRNAREANIALHAFFLEDLEALNAGGPVPPLSDFDAVLMNPPRVGAFDVAKVLAAGGPRTIAYVSCDPATLARDVRTLVEGGYAIAEITAFDMFPQTPHVEVLTTLVT